MSADWPEVRLEDITSVLGDGLHGTPKYDDDGDYYFINGNNLSNGKIIFNEKTKRATEKEYLKHKKNLNDRTILVSINGTLGNIALYNGEKVFLGKSACYFNVNEDVDKQFVRYVVSGYLFQNYIHSLATGSTINNVSLKLMRDFTFRLPPLEIQKAISKVLEDLDNKIELNRQTNQTLEQIAQAIFKSWFVDFEPTRAKIAAKERWLAINDITETSSPTCYAEELETSNSTAKKLTLEETMTQAAMAAISGKTVDELEQLGAEQLEQLKATAGLFPDALVESELGEIPEGWDRSEIGNEVTVVGGGTPSTKNEEFWDNGSINWTSPRDMSSLTDKILLETDRKITEAGLAKISSGLLPKDTVLMSSRAPVGYLAIAKIPVAINQGYIAIKCEELLTPEYVIQWAESVMDEIKQRASGTTFAEISKKNFKIIPVIVPEKGLLQEYSKVIKGLYEKITELLNETKSLTEIRDALLPKLLSGELEISGIA